MGAAGGPAGGSGGAALASRGAPAARGGRRAWPWLVVTVAILLAALVGGRPSPQGPALGPDSTGAQGAKALRLLLEGSGAQVEVSSGAPSGPTVALVLADVLGPAERLQLADWVRSGGTLVLADPRSPLAGVATARGPVGEPLLADGTLSPRCPLDALGSVSAISPGGGALLKPPSGTTACFPMGDGAFMLVRDLGAGTVVVLGGPGLWTNARLGHADNSVLAAALMAPRPGGRVTWMVAPRAGGGRLSLLGLISPRVKEGFWQLVVAFVLFGLWRARRLGRPVVENQPVELAGSELVVAVANLLQQGRRVGTAAGILRADLARVLADRLGVGSGTDVESLADLVSERAGVDRDQVLATLAGPGPLDEAGLLALAQAAEAIKREVAHAC